MAQSIQIVPKFSFPYAETVINDYTEVSNANLETTVDNSIKQVYVVTSSKGIDNTWVSKSTRLSAEKTFGVSNFKKFGQPLMQALKVLEQPNSQVWMMRVMPEHAAYSNAILSTFYKADTKDVITDAHLRKFRIKLCSKSVENATNASDFKKKIGIYGDSPSNTSYKDAEGYSQIPTMGVRTSGRGKYGDTYSIRVNSNTSYEKEYGIKMYNFEVINSENGLEKEANYVGSTVTSSKYGVETTTLINDILGDVEKGVAPVDVYVIEDNVETLYNEYIKWVKELHKDLEEEYKEKSNEYAIPKEQMNGTEPVSDDNKEHYEELKEIENMINATLDSELPDLDEFDLFRGEKVASTDLLPGIFYPKKLTSDVDTTAPDYKEEDYTTSDIVDFSSVTGLRLSNGSNGEFDTPRSIKDDVTGKTVNWTYDDEVTYCMEQAFDCVYDKKILSARRIKLTVMWDANYPFSVKQKLVDLALIRNDCRVHLDCGILTSLSASEFKTLSSKYSIFDDKLVSTDIHNYYTKESSTNKNVNVTISYFLAPKYIEHLTNVGFHVPFVKENCQLSGHVRDSLYPIIEEYDKEFKEKLYDNRFNYFECISENVFQRAVQNTRQVANTDLLEENNVTILYRLKSEVEADIDGEIYNFADERVRQEFVEAEKAKYKDWIGTILESFNIKFATSPYEKERSILHAYIEIVFRGLTKKAIVEIDINKRSVSTTTDETPTEE